MQHPYPLLSQLAAWHFSPSAFPSDIVAFTLEAVPFN